jgi:molybdopterin-binding protein
MADVEVTLIDIKGLQDRIVQIDRLYDSIEMGPFNISNGVVTNTFSIGYGSQIFNPSYVLDIDGKTRITRDTYLGENLYVDQATYVNGYTTLNGYAVLNSSCQVFGHLQAENNTFIYGNTYLDKRLDVSGNTSLWNPLEVLETTTLQGHLTVNSDTHLDKRLDVSGNTSLWNPLEVLETTTLQGHLTVNSDTHLDKRLDVSGNTSLWSHLEVLKTATFQNPVRMNSNVNVYGPKTFINPRNLEINSDTRVTGPVKFENDIAQRIDFDENTAIISQSLIEVVTLRYAQLDRFATTAMMFTDGQAVNRLVVKDYINPSVDPSSNASVSSTYMNDIKGYVTFQTDFTVHNNKVLNASDKSSNISDITRTVRLGASPLFSEETNSYTDDPIRMLCHTDPSSVQIFNGKMDITAEQVASGIDYLGNMLLTGDKHTLNSSESNFTINTFNLTTYLGTHNISTTFMNMIDCTTYYKGLYDIDAESNLSGVNPGIKYVGPVLLNGSSHVINSSSTQFICDYFWLNMSCGNISVTPDVFEINLKKGLVIIDRTAIQITDTELDLFARSRGSGIEYIGNVSLTGINTITSTLTNMSIDRLNLSTQQGLYDIQKTIMNVNNTSLNFSGNMRLTGTYDMTMSSIRMGIQYTGNVSLFGDNTIESRLTNMSIDRLNLSTKQGLYDIQKTIMNVNNTSLNFSGNMRLTGTYDMTMSSIRMGIQYTGNVSLFGDNTIESILTNMSIDRLNLSTKQGLYDIQNTIMNVNNTSLNFSGNMRLTGTYDMTMSSIRTGIHYTGNVSLFGDNTIESKLSNFSFDEFNCSTKKGSTYMYDTKFTLEKTILNVSGKTTIRGDILYNGNISLHSTSSIQIYPGISIINPYGSIEPAILITNASLSDTMFLQLDSADMNTSENKMAMGQWGLQLRDKLKIGYNSSFSLDNSNEFSIFQFDLNGSSRMTGNVLVEETIRSMNRICIENKTNSDDMFLRMDSTENNTSVNKFAFGIYGLQIQDRLTVGHTPTFGNQSLENFNYYQININGSANVSGYTSLDGNVDINYVLNCYDHIYTNDNSIYLGKGMVNASMFNVSTIHAGTIFSTNINSLNANLSNISTYVLDVSGEVHILGTIDMLGSIDISGNMSMNGLIATNNLSCEIFSLSEESNWKDNKITCINIEAYNNNQNEGSINTWNLSCFAITIGKSSTGNDFRSNAGIINDGTIFCKEIQIDNNSYRFEQDGDIASRIIACSEINCTKGTGDGTGSGGVTCNGITCTADTGIVTCNQITCTNGNGGVTCNNITSTNGTGIVTCNQITCTNGNGGVTCNNITCTTTSNGRVTCNDITCNNTITCTSGTGTITATTFNANSDRRLKTNIVELNSEKSNLLIRRLRPTTYDFIEGKKGCIGFIAQEIECLGLPVSKTTGFVGNINTDVVCSEGWFRTEHRLYIGNRISYHHGESELITEIVEEKEGMFRMKDPINGIVYVFGTEVNDLRSIDKDAIFTIAVSAIKRIDERITHQENKLDFLIKILGCALFYSLGASLYVLILSK